VAPYLALETFCYVIVESMMKGCCVIASDRGAIPELIKNEHNGIIIRNPTSEKFKNMINYLLSDKNKLYSICKNALYISNKLMNLSLHAQEIKNLYENIITERKQ
jgi:spore coat protein SA